MLRNETEQMRSLGLSEEEEETLIPEVRVGDIRPSYPADQGFFGGDTMEQPVVPQTTAAATPETPPALGLTAEDAARLGVPLPEPVDQPTATDQQGVSREELLRLGAPLPEESQRDAEEPDETLVGFDEQGFPREPFPPTFGAAAEEGIIMNTPEGEQRVDFSIPKDEFVQFNTRFYEQFTNYQDALDIYEQFKENKHTRTNIAGILVQTNPDTGVQTMIFPPEQPGMLLQWISGDLRADADQVENFGISLRTKGWASLVGTLGNIADVIGEVTEFVGSPFGVFQDQREATSTRFPRVETEGVVDQMIDDSVRMVVSSMIGSALALKIMASVTKPATLAQQSRQIYAGGAIAEAGTASEDLPPIFLGEDASLSFGILKDLDFTEPGTAARQLQNRLALAVEAYQLARFAVTAIEKTADTIGFAYSLTLKPLVIAIKGGEAPLEYAVFNRFVNKLLDAEAKGVTLDPFQRARLVAELAEMVEENKSVILTSVRGSGEETVELVYDTLAAIERGLSPEDLATLGPTLRGIRTGQITSGAPLTTSASTQPTRVLQEQVGGRIQDVGGPTDAAQIQAMRESAEGFAEQGRQVVRGAAGDVRLAEEALEEATNTLIADLARGGGLAAELQRLTNALPTEIPITRNTAREDIRRLVTEGYEVLSARKNELYSRIFGGEIDTASLFDVLNNINLDELSRASGSFQRKSPLRELMRLFQTEGPPGATGQTQTREEVIERANAFFAREPEKYNFGYFYTEIRPELSALAAELYARGEAGNGAIVRRIIRTIDEDMLEYAGARSPGLESAAREASEFYSQTFAPLFRDGPLADFANIYESTIRRDGIGRVSFDRQTRDLLEETLGGRPDVSEIAQLKRLLDRPELAGDSGLIPNFFMAEAALGASRTLRESAGTATDLSTYRESLINISEAIRDNFSMQARELDDFYLQVERVKNNRVALEEVVEQSQQRLKQIVDEVSQSELRAFFATNYASSSDPVLARFATISDPAPAFNSLFTQSRAETTQRLTAIMNRIDAAPPEQRQVLYKGLETAYLRTLRDNMIGRSPDVTGALNVLNRKIQQNIEEVDTLFAAGFTVYRDRPELMFTLVTLASEASQTDLMRRAVAISGMSPTEFNRQAAQATSRLIYTTVGPLTRFGTRMRAGATAIVEAKAPDQRAIRMWDRIVADGDYFVELARRYNRAPSLDRAAERALMQSFLAPQLYAGRSELEEDERRNLLLQRLPQEGLGSPAPPFSPRSVVDAAAQTELMLRDQISGDFQNP